jgi:FKBP-type peptidyl-prolyl cis-trans isomerase FkpA
MRLNLIRLFIFLAVFELASCQSQDHSQDQNGFVKVTPSGLEFYHHIANEGPRPKAGDYVFFTHTIKINNIVVDTWDPSSFENIIVVPDKFTPDVNNPWLIEVLMQTTEGDSVSFFKKAGELQFDIPESVNRADLLEYHLKVVKIVDEANYEKVIEEKFTAYELEKEENKLKIEEAEKLMASYFEAVHNDPIQKEKIESGTELIISLVENGTGPFISPGSKIQAHYYGTFQDGKRFDSSYEKGKPVLFIANPNQVIPGLYEAFKKLRVGSKSIIVIPPDMAYGKAGNDIIPPNSTLFFFLEILDVF